MIIKITPQIEEMARTLCGGKEKTCTQCDSFALCEFWIEASVLVDAGYRKQSEVIDEFVERLKEAPIKFALPLLGLQTKDEIEEYFNGIMLQVRDAIDSIAKEMKGGE